MTESSSLNTARGSFWRFLTGEIPTFSVDIIMPKRFKGGATMAEGAFYGEILTEAFAVEMFVVKWLFYFP